MIILLHKYSILSTTHSKKCKKLKKIKSLSSDSDAYNMYLVQTYILYLAVIYFFVTENLSKKLHCSKNKPFHAIFKTRRKIESNIFHVQQIFIRNTFITSLYSLQAIFFKEQPYNLFAQTKYKNQ